MTRRGNGGGRPWERGGGAAAISPLPEPLECMRAVAELKVEGPSATVTYEEPYAANPGTWTISSLMPSGS